MKSKILKNKNFLLNINIENIHINVKTFYQKKFWNEKNHLYLKFK